MTFDQIKDYIENPFAFIRRMGLRAIILEPLHVKLGLPLEGNENHIGSMYAGALFTLAEMPGGALFLTTFDASRFYPIIKEMSIRFLRPVVSEAFFEIYMRSEEAERIAAEAETRGKADFILEGEVVDVNGQVAAVSRGVYQARKY